MTKSIAFAGVAQSAGSHPKAVFSPTALAVGYQSFKEKAAWAQFVSETRKSVNGTSPIIIPITILITIPITLPITIPITLPETLPTAII